MVFMLIFSLVDEPSPLASNGGAIKFITNPRIGAGYDLQSGSYDHYDYQGGAGAGTSYTLY